MARFTARVEVGAPAPAVWDALVDWPRHGDWAPLTRVWVTTERPGGVGARFTGRTGLGPLGFDDPMEVVAWRPPADGVPGRCEIVKQGRVVLGRAAFDVVPLPGDRTRVLWEEDVDVLSVRLTRVVAPLVSLAGALAFRTVLRRAAREVEREVEREVGREVGRA